MGLTKHYNGWKVVFIKDKPLSYFRDLYFAFRLAAQERSQEKDENNKKQTNCKSQSTAYPQRKRTPISYVDLLGGGGGGSEDHYLTDSDPSDLYYPSKRLKLISEVRVSCIFLGCCPSPPHLLVSHPTSTPSFHVTIGALPHNRNKKWSIQTATTQLSKICSMQQTLRRSQLFRECTLSRILILLVFSRSTSNISTKFVVIF